MKKNIVSAMFLAIAAVSSYIGFNNFQSTDANLSNLCLDECEALAGCEIYDSNHNPIVKCEGDEDVCYEISDNLFCSGKKVN